MAEGTEISSVHVAVSADARGALTQLQSVLAAQRALTTTSGTVRVNVEDTQAKAALASLRAETAQMRAQTTAIKVTADTSIAGQQIRTLDAETRNLTARARVLKVEADTSQAMQALRTYEAETRRIQAVSNASNAGNASSTSLRGVATGALGGGPLATVGIVAGGFAAKEIADVTTASIDLNSKLQQANITFTTFLGSTEAADAHVQDLAKFAATTPFQFPDLITASSKMQAMGFAARDVIPDLRAIGNAESALGNGKEGIDRVVLALGQMQLKGHVAGDELLQLTEAGVPALQYLATAYGKTTAEITKMVEAGQINGKAGASAIIEGLSVDPKFADQMAKQSASFAGSMSNIQDAANMAAAKGLRPLFEEANNAAGALATFTASDSFTKGAEDFATTLRDDIDALKELGSITKDIGVPFEDLIKNLPGLQQIRETIEGINAAAQGITGNKKIRAEVDASTANLSDMDVAMQRVIANQKLLDMHQPQDFHGLRNPFSVIDYTRDLAQQKETVAEYDKILAKRQQINYENSKFIGPVDARDPNAVTPVDTAALKKHDEDVKAAAVDVANFQKFQIQQASDAQVAAATRSADAWKAASAEVSHIDLSRGISSLTDASVPLHKVVDDLATLGKSDSHLNNLTKIADTFKSISDAEKQASASYDGFMLSLDQTDKRVAAIDGLKSRLLAAVDAAQQAQVRGTATSNDLATIAGAPAAFAQLNFAEVQLKGNASQDWAGIIQGLPEWLKGQLQADSSTRSAIGDGKQLLTTVKVETAQAERDLTTFEKEDRQAVVTITANTKDAIASIDALIAHMPTSIPLLITTQTGQPDPTRGYDGGGPPANPAGWNQYQPLSMSQYSSIVKEGSGGKVSPFDDPTMYAAVLAAAQQYGVDPRVLLAFTKAENNNATNISSSLLAANNYGGIKGPGGPMSPEGDTYRAFSSPAEFFKALAANLSTGAYAGDYQSGNLNSVARRYVGSDSPGRVNDYANYAAQYPATNDPARGYGAPITRGTGYGPGDVALGSSQTPTGGDVSQSVVSSVRNQIVAKALQSVNQDKLVDECERFVEETVQAITGKRGATGINEQNATVAFQHAQAQGLERPADQAPQAGDLVYYPDANGGPGHVAVYAGKGQQISTWDKGDPTGENRKIHVESISPGARFVMVPGTQSDTTRASGAAASGIPGQANVPGAGVSAQSLEQLARAVAHVDEKGAALKQTLSTLAPRDFSATISQFNTLGPILDKMAHANDNESTTPTAKIQESADALAKNIVATNLWGRGLDAITTKSGHLADVEREISSTVGGPLATALNTELERYQDVATIADRINQLTQRKTDLETAHNQALQARQTADTAESRSQTRQGWADQAVDRRLAARQEAETHANTIAMRGFEDRQRALTQYGTTQKRQLQDQLTGLEKAHSLAISATKAQEQVFSARAFAGDTSASMRLAIGHDATKVADDGFATQKQKIQDAITAEDKLASQQQYDLETQRLAESRASEDRLRDIQNEGTRNQANRAARDEAHTIEQWQIEDTRAREDVRYNLAITSIDKEIAAQQTLATAADANLKAAQDALSFWQQTGIAVQQAASFLSALAQITGATTSPQAAYRNIGGLR